MFVEHREDVLMCKAENGENVLLISSVLRGCVNVVAHQQGV